MLTILPQLRTDDLLAIFFPHMFEDLEYLLPPEELGKPEERRADDMQPSSVQENAEAGPSRRR